MSLRRCVLTLAVAATTSLAACSSSGHAARRPSGPPEPTGSAYALYTHCGIHEARVGHTYYVADDPLDDGHGNPPAGWGNPYQQGTMATPTPGVAVFSDSLGHVVRFHARPGATSFLQICK